MKIIIISILAIGFLAALGSQVPDAALGASQASMDHEQAGEVSPLAGTWYAAPSGSTVRFNGDGTADFGVDSAGRVVGFSANSEVEGERLSVWFSNYEGDENACYSDVGVYRVQYQAADTVRFFSIADDCVLRQQLLTGKIGAGPLALFHLVK